MASVTFNINSIEPMIPVKFFNKNKSVTINVLVDTGAFGTVLRTEEVTHLGLDVRSGDEVIVLNADEGAQKLYYHDLQMQIGHLKPINTRAAIGNFDVVGKSVLGRAKGLSNYAITFHGSNITFSEISQSTTIKPIREFNTIVRSSV